MKIEPKDLEIGKQYSLIKKDFDNKKNFVQIFQDETAKSPVDAVLPFNFPFLVTELSIVSHSIDVKILFVFNKGQYSGWLRAVDHFSNEFELVGLDYKADKKDLESFYSALETARMVNNL